MNIFMQAKERKISPEVEYIAQEENIPVEVLMKDFAEGSVVILKNPNHDIKPKALGKNISTKINANLGSSPDLFDLKTEIKKLKIAVDAGADAVMDLSTGGDLIEFQNTLLAESAVPLGTVPLYEMAVTLSKKGKSVMDMTIDDYLEVIERQAKQGVDFMTIHAGLTKETLKSLNTQKRIIGITSRGGSILAEWMDMNNAENPLYEHYDKILEILKKYNVAISLGDSLRPGCLHDASDRGQIHELIVIGELVDRARAAGVQAIVEGPGHVPLNLIEDNMRLEKELCKNAPYYVLGPIVTDIAPGYDHITGAIGGAIAAASGADFLCYLTPAEHLRLPDLDDVHEGVIASKIAAHAADIIKLGNKARQWDDQMSHARQERDWEKMYELAIDEKKARKFRSEIESDTEHCSMCGEFCAMKRKAAQKSTL